MEGKLNPAHDYHKIAKKLEKMILENVSKTITTGQAPDLYFSIEKAIMDALVFADKKAAERTRADIERIIEEFDRENGHTQN